MKLSQGDLAINFDLVDVHNRKVHLEEYQGKRVLLSFYRGVSCPFCNLRVHQLNKLVPELNEQGLELIFFFETPKKHILLSSFHTGLTPIPIIADPEKKIYKEYGVESSATKAAATFLKKGIQDQLRMAKDLSLDNIPEEKSLFPSATIPADFLINENGIIQKAYYGNSINDHLPVAEIKQFATLGEVTL